MTASMDVFVFLARAKEAGPEGADMTVEWRHDTLRVIWRWISPRAERMHFGLAIAAKDAERLGHNERFMLDCLQNAKETMARVCL